MNANKGDLTATTIERRLRAKRADVELDALFGSAQHAELRELAQRAGRPPRGAPRVLILPGIMGSTLGLRRKGRADDVKWFDPVEIALGGLTKLSLPSKRRIEPLGVMLFAYLRLKLSLRAAGLDADFHPYDWRHSVWRAGHTLAERLLGDKSREVHLVAHSMGGLVARAALAAPGAEKLGRVVQLGTPNRGAFGAVQALRGTHPLVRRIGLLDLAHGARTLARDVFTTLPGLVELLPAAEACESFDPFRAGDWPQGPRPDASLLKAASQARRDLPPPDPCFALIAGTGHKTPTGLRLRDGQLEFRHSDDGDGTVPLALAQCADLVPWYTQVEHGRLPADETVTRAVIELLEHGTTDLLPRERDDVSRRGTWTAEDTGDEAAGELFWDDLSGPEQRLFLREFAAPPAEDGSRTWMRATRAGDATAAVELRLILGSIAEQATEAIVLGVFSNVEPAGAALAVDEALGGVISDLARRRAISAAAGEVFILPAVTAGLRARYVVFAGLGSFGRYGAEVQRLAAANVTRTLALAGVRDMALVLWGTASGVPPAHAAQSQLNGLLEALAELEPGRRLRRVTVVSRSQRRLDAARMAMELAIGASRHAALVNLRPATASRVRRQKSAPRGALQSYLFVQESAGELRTALLGATPKATALAATRRLDENTLDEHLESLGEGFTPDGIAAFGERLGELLLPVSTREALAAVHDTPLVVVHDTAASRWPWEALSVDGWAPAAAAGLSRRYAAEGLSVAKWRESRRLSPVLQVLLVINPTDDLAGAEEEGSRVAATLDRQGAQVQLLRGSEATRARLLTEFRSGNFDAIHYAGHAFFDAAAPASSGILCAGGRVLSGGDLASLDALPALVCFNACESGRIRQQSRVARALGRSAGFAEAFLRGGVANFIGTWWPVSDAAAARFATSLYGRLTRGATIGAALHAARSAVRRLGCADWANYLHYGSLDFVLKDRR
jgi:hypothetical protein